MDDVGPWRAKARAPAHVTGFFEIVDDVGSYYRQGSRGAGLNLELMVTSDVTIHTDGSGIGVTIDGHEADAATTRLAASHLLGNDYPARVDIAIDTGGLRSGQGFGLSGAGTLASCMAIAELTGIPVKRGLWSAHRAEILRRTGLGDVPAQFVGGAEIRVTPGALPMGVVERFAGLESRRVEVVCCVLGGQLATSEVLVDEARRKRINAAGGSSVPALQADPTLDNYMRLARRFADEIGLIDDDLQAALDVADGYGPATQTMLGRALHMIPRDVAAADEAVEVLAAHGEVWRTKVSLRGAHIVRQVAARNA